MRARRALTVVGAAAASAAGAVLLRRRAARRRERIDLYLEDGSLVSFTQGSPDAERLLLHAREALRAAQ